MGRWDRVAFEPVVPSSDAMHSFPDPRTHLPGDA